MLQTGLTPEKASVDEEFWCGVLQEVAVPGCREDPALFMKKAVEFANEKCWGTLSCVVVAHPRTQHAYKIEFETAIAELQYGTVAINVPGTVAFGVTRLGWGGFPGINSGKYRKWQLEGAQHHVI